MTLPRWTLVLMTRLAPALGLAILLVFGALVLSGATRHLRVDPTTAAWISALLALAWLLTRLPAHRRGARTPHAERDPTAELAFEMSHGRGPAGWRRRALARLRPWHGRSPDNVRPRFD